MDLSLSKINFFLNASRTRSLSIAVPNHLRPKLLDKALGDEKRYANIHFGNVRLYT